MVRDWLKIGSAVFVCCWVALAIVNYRPDSTSVLEETSWRWPGLETRQGEMIPPRWSPETVVVPKPGLSVGEAQALHSLVQQRKWSRKFGSHPLERHSSQLPISGSVWRDASFEHERHALHRIEGRMTSLRELKPAQPALTPPEMMGSKMANLDAHSSEDRNHIEYEDFRRQYVEHRATRPRLKLPVFFDYTKPSHATFPAVMTTSPNDWSSSRGDNRGPAPRWVDSDIDHSSHEDCGANCVPSNVYAAINPESWYQHSRAAEEPEWAQKDDGSRPEHTAHRRGRFSTSEVQQFDGSSEGEEQIHTADGSRESKEQLHSEASKAGAMLKAERQRSVAQDRAAESDYGELETDLQELESLRDADSSDHDLDFRKAALHRQAMARVSGAGGRGRSHALDAAENVGDEGGRRGSGEGESGDGGRLRGALRREGKMESQDSELKRDLARIEEHLGA